MSRESPAYRLTLRPPAAIAAALLCLLLAGCGSDSSSGDGDAGPPAAATATMAVSGARATIAPMRGEVRLLGSTAALRHISLRAPAAGRVLGMNLQTGDRVARGEIVAHIISREVEAAQSGLAVARQIDPSEAPALAASVRRYEGGGGIAVRAPENAIVAQRIVSSGQMVADLDPLADLIDPRGVYVEAAVPVDSLAAIRPGMDAIVTSPLHPGTIYAARVAAIAPAFNQNGATSPARIEFTGASRISEAGAPVEVRVTTTSVPDATTAPAAALFEDAANDSYYVFVAGADGRARRTAVTLGLRTPSRVQIVSGVSPGQIVITSGGYALSDGLKVTVALAQQ
jgi:multidrug efflux pump subunit AcrA (membrane-fusion protein)